MCGSCELATKTPRVGSEPAENRRFRGRIPGASPVVSFTSAKTVSNEIWEAVTPDVFHTSGSGFGLLSEAPRSTTVPSVTETAKSTSDALGTTVFNTWFWGRLASLIFVSWAAPAAPGAPSKQLGEGGGGSPPAFWKFLLGPPGQPRPPKIDEIRSAPTPSMKNTSLRRWPTERFHWF